MVETGQAPHFSPSHPDLSELTPHSHPQWRRSGVTDPGVDVFSRGLIKKESALLLHYWHLARGMVHGKCGVMISLSLSLPAL
jgi:hypothetical protein